MINFFKVQTLGALVDNETIALVALLSWFNSQIFKCPTFPVLLSLTTSSHIIPRMQATCKMQVNFYTFKLKRFYSAYKL